MRIDPKAYTSLAASVAASRPREVAEDERFSVGTGGAKSTQAGAARSAAPLATMDAILALQGEADPGERKRRSARRGREILDALDGLKAAMLGGRVSPAELGRLQRGLADVRDGSGDPELDGIVAEIELRAAVELAKLERRP